ncbi:MAG: COX15/CtaA family protein [Candidatus Zixiibacteriota bacterium]|jgi:cytochrome c oxidase assembly protein subunit 15
MNKFLKFAFISTLATYFVIFLGGLVRVSGAGLGCPDWPRCFGRWFPPTSVNQLPPDIDPSLFNFTLAWIEYVNRLGGVALGILIFILAILALTKVRQYPRLLYPTLASLLLVAFQGWQGGQVVASELEPLFVSVHMGIAFIIVSLLIYVTQQAYYIVKPDEEKNAVYPGKTDRWILLLWILTFIQIVMGTEIRSSVEILQKEFPLLSESEYLGRVGIVSHLHTFLGIVIAIGAWQTAGKILRTAKNPSPLVRQSSWGLMALVALQVLVGALLMIIGLPEVMQVFHLWLASLLVGTLLILFSALKQYGRKI